MTAGQKDSKINGMTALYAEAMRTPPSRRSNAQLRAIIEHMEQTHEEQPVPFSTKLRPSLRAQVGDYARANGMKIQEVVAEALTAYINRD